MFELFCVGLDGAIGFYKAVSVLFQLQLPAGTELDNNLKQYFKTCIHSQNYRQNVQCVYLSCNATDGRIAIISRVYSKNTHLACDWLVDLEKTILFSEILRLKSNKVFKKYICEMLLIFTIPHKPILNLHVLTGNKLGLNWAKLSSSWSWALLQS